VEVADGFELFAKPGYVHAKVKVSASALGVSASDSVSDDSFSWAVGGQYNFTDRIYGQIDYASYFDKGGDKVSGPSISIGFKF
jgi:opacity protein-like surface antigen